jgi:hypothetical protein
MKKLLIIFLFACTLNKVASQITYTFSTLAGTYTSLSSYTTIPEIFWGSDNVLSSTYSIGFNFQFGCTTYTAYRVSADGWLTFNLTGSVSFADAINDLSGYAGMRPGIAPLWDDLDWNTNAAPICGYAVSGVSPLRVLTVQWTAADWKAGSAAAISFQIKLYETSNRIEMIYHQLGGALNSPSGSIGLAGPSIGDYYSVNTSFTGATKTTNVQNIASKPAEGTIFRWDTPCGLLPIELLFFNGENSSEGNLLRWCTQTETNNMEFYVETSTDGIQFEPLQKIKGSGDSQIKKYYSYLDKDPSTRVTYYRLKQTDLNGQFSYSSIISVSRNDLNSDIRLFPVPADKNLTVTGASNTSFTITDISGKILKQGMLSSYAISVDDLANGMYFLRTDDSPPVKFTVHHQD